MYNRYIFILLILIIITGFKNLYATSKYIPGIDGLPLMAGLQLIPEKQVFFDTVNGRIIEVFVYGKNLPGDVLTYYRATLQQLGWVPTSQNEFRREEEQLRIKVFDDKTKKFIIRFSISPISN